MSAPRRAWMAGEIEAIATAIAPTRTMTQKRDDEIQTAVAMLRAFQRALAREQAVREWLSTKLAENAPLVQQSHWYRGQRDAYQWTLDRLDAAEPAPAVRPTSQEPT